MAIKRSEQIDSENAGYYHLMSRCVRRAFLCGVDEATGISFEHRRAWIEQRIVQLAEIFAIEVYSYAVMHNHYHLVVYSNPLGPCQWTDLEVADRWLRLFPGKLNNPQLKHQRALRLQAIADDKALLAEYRHRLGSISWLMRCINEPIAKRSNQEDCVKGHFWESRFTSQALLDEAAALTCMAYVDLNPVRAGLTDSLETSDYTSIQSRLNAISEAQLNKALESLAGKVRERTMVIPLKDYIELVEWTGKTIIHPNKAHLPSRLLPILQQLNINQASWLNQVNHYERNFYRAVGPLDLIRAYAERLKLKWLKGISNIRALYLTTT
ncbi:transposase [Aliikangiella marina]|uniref:Transposase n=1 Tax=Aliikangiella marina TaxID=1712262 RepID=A0A545T2Q4_9GAMM|nr:transposase [Aliikangiella marina]TQV71465.1 transposase [Aliikangiella marina]